MKNITEVAAPLTQSGSANHSGQFAVQWNSSSEEAIEGSTIALGSISLSGGSAKSLVISALPVGAVLSDGQGHSFTATAGQTSVNVTAWNLSQLSVTPPNDSNFVLTVTATHASGATATATEGVIVDPFAPTIAVAPISGVEGSAIALNLAATVKGLPGDSNNLSNLVISNIPVGAVLSDQHGHNFTSTTSSSQVDVHAWNYTTLTIVAPNDQNFTLSIAATAADADGNTSAATHATEAVIVNPLEPTVSWSPSAKTGVEGSSIALGTISATVNGLAGDSNSLASLVVSGIPVGATLSDGNGHSFTASAGNTDTDVLGWSLASLTLTSSTAANFTLTVTPTERDVEGNLDAPASSTESITVNPLAPTVSWSPSTGTGVEGTSIALGTISTTVNGLAADSNSLASLVVSGIPVGATLSDGNGHSFTASVGHADADVLGWSLGSLTITPITAANFTLTVTATERDAEGDLGAPASSTESITVNPLAPTVSWLASAKTGVEGSPIALGTISATVNGVAGDSNSLLSLVISGIPVGATLSDGNGHSFTASAGNTDTNVLGWSLASLTVTPSTDANFTFTVTATERDAEGNINTTHATEAVTVKPLAPTASWSPSTETGVEGSPIALGTISTTVNGLAGDSNSAASLVVSGIPVGATLSDGNGHSFTASVGNTDTDVLGWSLASLTVTPSTAANFTLTVTATEHDSEGNLGASASSTESMTVNPLAPAVSWSPSAETGVEGLPIALCTISATVNGLAGDSNSLVSLVVSGIPVGATLSDGNGHSFSASVGHTDTGVLSWSLASLAITSTTVGSFKLTVTATERDTEGNLGASASSSESITVHNPYTSLDLTGEWLSYAQAINDSGQVAGWYQDNSVVHGFVYSAGTYTALDDPLTTNGTAAQAINGAGEVAGYYYDNSGQSHGFIYNAGTYTTVDDPLGVNGTVPLAINASGEVVGSFTDNLFQSHGFLYSAGTYTTLDDPLATFGTTPQAMNDNGEVVGYYQNNTGAHGFIYNAGTYATLDDPLATEGTVALGVNGNGEVVGYYNDSTGGQHGFIYNAGTYTTMDDPLATGGTYAAAINNSGQVAGDYTDNTGQHGFLYSNDTYTTVDEPASTAGTTITAINGSGQIAGAYFTPTIGSFIYAAGAFTNLRDPVAATQTYANAINDNGQVVGFDIDNTGYQHGFIYSAGTYSTLDDPLATNGTDALGINGNSQVVGDYTDNNGQHGFLYHTGTYTTLDDPLATNGTDALGINGSGQVVGDYNDNTGQHGFIYNAGTYTTLDDPLATFGTAPQAINGTGEVVGSYYDSTGQHGFIYNAGTYITLNDPLATNGTVALGVNGSGEVLGYYSDNTGQHGFIYNAGTYTTLDDPLATGGTYAVALNDSGQVAGYYNDESGQLGFLYSNGTYTTIENHSTTQNVTGVASINNLGEVVGYYEPVSSHGFTTA